MADKGSLLTERIFVVDPDSRLGQSQFSEPQSGFVVQSPPVSAYILSNESDVTPIIGDTIYFNGFIGCSDDITDVPLVVTVRRKSDDAVIATVFSGTVNLSSGLNDIASLLTAAQRSWDTTGQGDREYYFLLSLDSGATKLSQQEPSKIFFEVLPDPVSPAAMMQEGPFVP